VKRGSPECSYYRFEEVRHVLKQLESGAWLVLERMKLWAADSAGSLPLPGVWGVVASTQAAIKLTECHPRSLSWCHGD